MSEAEISGKRKKRGVVRASTTRLKTKVRELEGTIDHPDTPSHARRISQKLDTLSSEFMDVHYNLVELIEDGDVLVREQAILDEFEDDTTQIAIAIERLLSSCASASTSDSNSKKLLSRKLSRLKGKLEYVSDATTARSIEDTDVLLLQEYEASLVDHKRELSEVQRDLMMLDLDETDELCVAYTDLEDIMFDISLSKRKLLQAVKDASTHSKNDRS